MLGRNLENGLVTGTTLGTLTTARTYNGFAELASITADAGATALYSACPYQKLYPCLAAKLRKGDGPHLERESLRNEAPGTTANRASAQSGAPSAGQS